MAEIEPLGAITAFGYHSSNTIERYHSSSTGKFLKVHNVLNIVSIVLSTLAGLVRLFLSAGMLCRLRKNDGEDAKAAKQFYRAEVVRSLGEIIGLGLIITIADIVVTMKRYEKCCFKTHHTIGE